jgi:hypothetical protein
VSHYHSLKKIGQKRTKTTAEVTHLLWLSSPLSNPWFGLVPSLVESKQTRLSTTFDKLIGLGDELGGEDPTRKL